MSDVGRYRRLYTRLWKHPNFRRLTDRDKLLALYVLTGPQTNRHGIHSLSLITASEDLKLPPRCTRRSVARLCRAFGWQFDPRSSVMYIPSWFKWNPPDNVNVMKGILNDLNEIPPSPLIAVFAKNIETLPVTLRPTFAEGLRQRFPNGMPIQEQEQEQEQDLSAEPALRAMNASAALRASNAKGDSRQIAIACRDQIGMHYLTA